MQSFKDTYADRCAPFSLRWHQVLNVKRSTEDAARKEEEDTGVWSWSETGTELTKQLSLWVPKEGPVLS